MALKSDDKGRKLYGSTACGLDLPRERLQISLELRQRDFCGRLLVVMAKL